MYNANKVTIRDEQINRLFCIYTWNMWKWAGPTKFINVYQLLRGANHKLLYVFLF